MKLKFKKLHPNAILPVYATAGAAGMDIHACLDEAVVLHPGEAAAIPTGFAMEIPDGYEAQIRGRSGLAFKNAVFSHNGTIDSDYRGEVKGLLINHSKVPFVIEPNMRIAQMVINAAVVKCRPVWVEEISMDTARGEGGFGSTGTHAFDEPATLEEIVQEQAVNLGYVRYSEDPAQQPPHDNVVVMEQLLCHTTGKKK